MADTNAQVAQQTQLKHQFYVLTLCFTVLALAVETADFDGPLAADAIELAGWLCLLISGLIGLFRFELVPKLYQLFDAQIHLKQDKSQLQKANFLEDGEIFSIQDNKNVPISELVTRVEGNLTRVNEAISERSNKITAQYLLHRWLFVTGVVALVTSRGYKPAASILEALYDRFG
ncbi:MAG TPA: hypothetical protein VHE58_08925 [Burkholderiales bacterium]|nr:hypothetical protein [Burkholderiales bacterium]